LQLIWKENHQRMDPKTLWLGVVGLAFLFVGVLAVFWPGETNQTGKLFDGSGVSIKKQQINRYRSPSNTVWKPNGWLPGVGKINGHGVDYTFRVWGWGLFFGVFIAIIAFALLRRALP
jgi:uncharacterized membrane protein HdeD (DUF308 family)